MGNQWDNELEDRHQEHLLRSGEYHNQKVEDTLLASVGPWFEYDSDQHATELEGGSYLCRLIYPDGGERYRVKYFYIHGKKERRGYFATSGGKAIITHCAKIVSPKKN